MQVTHILIIDDELRTCQSAIDLFEGLGYRVTWAKSGEAGLAKARQEQPDLILLDWLFKPQGQEQWPMQGLDILNELGKDYQTAYIPVIIYSIKGDDIQIKIEALRRNSVKHSLPKIMETVPRAEELKLLQVAVSNALQRKEKLVVGEGIFRYEPASRTALIQETPLQLPRLEDKLYCLLVSRKGEIIGYKEIAEVLYPGEVYDSSLNGAILRVINSLRRKIEPILGHSRNLENRHGVGYRLYE
ncbi:MAG TPA: response regulator transcription factor [Chloroflexia bacterium]|nr:response regulator transcription factor [Chloroflexia bacterium]